MSDEAPTKVASRPGSMWAHGKRTNVKGFDKKPGFYRGARVKSVTTPATHKSTLENKPK